MQPYKINIHAHSIFSDGYDSPVILAQKALELGFTALVLTDHYYDPTRHSIGLTTEKLPAYRRAINEAKKILPVIVGVETPIYGQEVLIFGGAGVKYVIENEGIHTKADLHHIKELLKCAVILCHPSDSFERLVPYVHGYERHNGTRDMFAKDRPLAGLEDKQAWHNSDAHMVGDLRDNYTLVNKKITCEADLINYIRKNKTTTKGE